MGHRCNTTAGSGVSISATLSADAAPQPKDDDGDAISWDDNPNWWRFNESSVPSYLDAQTVREEVREAAENID